MRFPVRLGLPLRWRVGSVGVLLALAVPHLLPSYRVFNASRVLILTLVGASLVMLVGWLGQVSLAHGAFLGTGAWMASSLTHQYDAPFLVAVFGAGAIAGLVALTIGFPALRLRGIYLAAATLAYQVAFEKIFLVEAFKGDNALVSRPTVFGIDTAEDSNYYYVTLVIVVALVALLAVVRRARTGRAWIAIRDLEGSSQVVGIPVQRYKLLGFALSGALAGVGGALLLFLVGGSSNQQFLWYSSVTYLALAFIGGITFLAGPVVGGLIYVVSGEYFGNVAAGYNLLMGTTLAVLAAYVPDGLIGGGLRVVRRYTRRSPSADPEFGEWRQEVETPRPPAAPTGQLTTGSRRLGDGRHAPVTGSRPLGSGAGARSQNENTTTRLGARHGS